MATRKAKHLIVRTAAGFHERLVAANGNPIDQTKVYPESRPVRRAIAISIEAALVLAGVDVEGTPREVATAAARSVPIVDERE
jgi:hypothetical protein